MDTSNQSRSTGPQTLQLRGFRTGDQEDSAGYGDTPLSLRSELCEQFETLCQHFIRRLSLLLLDP